MISDEALILIALAGVCGIPLMTAVIFVSVMWLLRKLGYDVR